MSFEVEVKYRLVDHDQLKQRVQAQGASLLSTVAQEDIYLSHPARDFAQTNEAFRLRRVGHDNRITYKGPRRGGPTKTREEIEISVEPGRDAFVRVSKLFENLGFRNVASVRKLRTVYRIVDSGRTIEIALDDVDGLGPFAEIEAQAEAQIDLPAAQAAVLAYAEKLGLTEVEPRSYLRMVLESRRN
jgi:adenylate cyclase class 2